MPWASSSGDDATSVATPSTTRPPERGSPPQYLSEIERGRKEPSSEMIAAVAGALDVTLLDLTLAVAESIHRLQERSLAQRRVGGTGVVDG